MKRTKQTDAARNQRDITGIWRSWVKIRPQTFTNSGRQRHKLSQECGRDTSWRKSQLSFSARHPVSQSGPRSARRHLEQTSSVDGRRGSETAAAARSARRSWPAITSSSLWVLFIGSALSTLNSLHPLITRTLNPINTFNFTSKTHHLVHQSAPKSVTNL